MEKFNIICETISVSRGTIKERKTSIEESFEKLSDAEFYLQKLCIHYRREMNRQLDDEIKKIDFRDKYLCITFGNGYFRPFVSKLYYICKRMA